MNLVYEAMLSDYLPRGWVPIPLYGAPDGVCNCDAGEGCGKRTGKHARVRWRDRVAVPDELEVRSWAQRYRVANVGIVCGPSGLYVVDLDGPQAVATWAGWLDQHGRTPTLTSRTRRGYHLWFRQPDGEPLGNSASSLAPGIDGRGIGGLIVAPPSMHASGHQYTWCDGPTEPAACPSWLEELARAAASPPPVDAIDRPPVRVPVESRRQHAYLSRAVEGEIQRVLDAGEGNRNHTLNRASYSLGQLVGAGLLDADAVAQALLAAAEAVGLDQLEAVPTIRSGLRAGAQHPRSLAS